MRHANPLTIGLNCALGANAMRAHLAELSDVADTFICAYPNAGLPNAFGQYDENARIHGRADRGLCRIGLCQHRGGCCGSTTGPYPRHRPGGEQAQAKAGAPGRTPAARLAGLEPFTLTKDIPFVNVGERTNVTGSARFRKLITAGDYTAALDVARDQVANGAQVIASTWTRA